MVSNRSNIFAPMENRSVLIPKNKSIDKGAPRIRLPSIQRKGSFNDSEIKVSERSREKSKSREKLQAESSERRESSSSRIRTRT